MAMTATKDINYFRFLDGLDLLHFYFCGPTTFLYIWLNNDYNLFWSVI